MAVSKSTARPKKPKRKKAKSPPLTLEDHINIRKDEGVVRVANVVCHNCREVIKIIEVGKDGSPHDQYDQCEKCSKLPGEININPEHIDQDVRREREIGFCQYCEQGPGQCTCMFCPVDGTRLSGGMSCPDHPMAKVVNEAQAIALGRVCGSCKRRRNGCECHRIRVAQAAEEEDPVEAGLDRQREAQEENLSELLYNAEMEAQAEQEMRQQDTQRALKRKIQELEREAAAGEMADELDKELAEAEAKGKAAQGDHEDKLIGAGSATTNIPPMHTFTFQTTTNMEPQFNRGTLQPTWTVEQARPTEQLIGRLNLDEEEE